MPQPARSTLFPYTTLFRSDTALAFCTTALAEVRHEFSPEPIKEACHVEQNPAGACRHNPAADRKSTRLNSSHGYSSYAVFCLKKKNSATDNKLELRLAVNC